VIRWYATVEPQQHVLPAAGVREFGISLPGSDNRTSTKHAPGRRP
jgi:hypothetical protein